MVIEGTTTAASPHFCFKGRLAENDGLLRLYYCRWTSREHPMDINEEKPEAPERIEAIAERLAFKSRFVMLFGEINHAVARTTCTRLIALAEDSDAGITVLISSPGGHV